MSGDVLNPGEGGGVPLLFEKRDEGLPVVVQTFALVGKPLHAVAAGRHAGQERRPRRRAGRRGGERLAEDHPLVGKTLQAQLDGVLEVEGAEREVLETLVEFLR